MDLSSMLTTDRDPVTRRVTVNSMLATDLDPVPNGMNVSSVLTAYPVPARNRMSLDTILTSDLDPVGSLHTNSTSDNTYLALGQGRVLPIPTTLPEFSLELYNAAMDAALQAHHRNAYRRLAMEDFLENVRAPISPNPSPPGPGRQAEFASNPSRMDANNVTATQTMHNMSRNQHGGQL